MAHHILPAIVSAVLFLVSSVCTLYLALQPHNALWYAKVAAGLGLTWAFGITLYNLTFHPLAKYPGPLVAACTDWYSIYHIMVGDRHVAMHHEHLKHGKFVRMGPNRLSINSAAAYRDMHDVNANTLKSDVFRIFKRMFGEDSSMTTVDHKVHAFRRRVNMTALTPQGVKALESRIMPHIDYMIEQRILPHVGTAAEGERGWGPGVDLSRAIRYLFSDIMGDMVFSRGWNVQRDPKNRNMVEKMNEGVGGLFILGHMQVLYTLGLHWVIFMNRMYYLIRLMLWAQSTSSWRASQTDMDHKGAYDRDIWSVLLNARDPKTGRSFSPAELRSEAFMFITAGTDTMITTTCATLFHLVHDPARLARASRDVRAAFPLPPGVDVSASRTHCPIPWAGPELQELTYLTACMDEAMRLCSAIPGHLQRKVGPGGMVIDGEWLPEGVDVGVPHYSLQRSPEHFDNPLEFIPERWLREGGGEGAAGEESGHAARDRRQAEAFTPFGVGRYSCIGKHLAYQEVIMILARLLWFFDIRQEPGNTLGEGSGKSLQAGRDRRNEYQQRDRFVSEQDGPVVQFRLREGFAA